MAINGMKIRNSIGLTPIAQPTVNVVAGDFYFDSTANQIVYWNGTSWLNLSSLTGTETLTNKALTSPSISAATITGLTTLTDAATIVNASTTSKVLAFNLSGMTAAKTLTLSSGQTTTQTLTIPNITTSDTLATLGLSQTFSGATTFSASGTGLTVNNSALISGNLTVSGYQARQELVDNTTTGSNAALNSAAQSLVILTKNTLTSLSTIPAGVNGQILVLTNQTGSSITINNQSGSPAANQITTGTGANMTLANNASTFLTYDNNTSKWLVIGGSGGGGSTLTSLGIFAGKSTLGSGVTSVSPTFSTAFGSTGYAVTAVLLNTTDSNPQFQPVTITAQSTTGFTASWNAPTATANYILSWQAILNN